jgi:hypothetical protein
MVVNNSNITSELLGCTIRGATQGVALVGEARSCTFDGNGQINAGTTLMRKNSYSGFTGTTGALLWNGSINVEDCSFTGNNRAIQHPATGTFNYTNLNFSGNTYDVNNTSNGLVTINIAGGSNPSVLNAGSSTTEIINARQKVFTNLPMNCEVRIRQGSHTLAHQQNVTTGMFVYSYGVTDRPAIAQFTSPGFDIPFINLLLDGNDQVFAVQVFEDPSYI